MKSKAASKLARVIKRYNNRRLYDFGVCRYITQADVKRIVRSGQPFRIIDTAGRNIKNDVLGDIAGRMRGRRVEAGLCALIRA